ncbi:hypothetical protein CBW65_09995 [Tumebacillus avium]|uniref:Uncharacterized protein n=1 Tax=Tumebacillus avium TaxID=1903704 RepID=A0A1Y0IML1_9BACL|nr:hypothetical protein [Tumebacillus avium]ARU61289.1 hypothetical protein CBW65_09995 [Tumebacillus avium]
MKLKAILLIFLFLIGITATTGSILANNVPPIGYSQPVANNVPPIGYIDGLLLASEAPPLPLG